MKQKLVMLIIVLFTIFSAVKAQDYNNTIRWSPINLALNQLNLGWEQNHGKNSLILDIGIPINRSIETSGYSFTKFGTESIRVGYRFYTTNKIKKYGLYLEPYFRTTTFRLDGIPQGQTAKFTSFLNTDALGLQAGYQFILSKNIVIDFYFAGLEGGRAHGWIDSNCGSNINALKMNDFILSKVKNTFPTYIVNHFQGGIYDGRCAYEITNFAYPMFRGGFAIALQF